MKMIATLLLIVGMVAAQSKPESAPALKTEDQLSIRNLQYEQDKKLIEMKNLEAQYRELQDRYRALQEESKQSSRLIEAAVRYGAKAAGADLEKFVLDLDSLRFVPRPKPSEVKPK